MPINLASTIMGHEMISSTGNELRKLVSQIQTLLLESPVLSVAGAPVRNCCDHLSAIAAVHDYHDVEIARKNQL